MPDSSLTFAEVRQALLKRLPMFKNEKGELTNPNGVNDWLLSQWSNAMCGEAGEAANIVKKIERDGDSLARKSALGDELADLILYTIYVAERAGIDLPDVIGSKFNRTSAAQGLPILL